MSNITVVILAKNAEKEIEECIKSVAFSSEIIVIDDDSIDKTALTAKKLDAAVYTRSLSNDFSAQRNFGLTKATQEWVLFIDTDERVSEQLASEILFLTSQVLNDVSAYYVRRIDTMWGRKLLHGETGNIKLLRLAKKESGEWKGVVHEEWKVHGKIGELKHPLLHYPHQTVAEFLQEINFYTDLRAKELFAKKIKVNWGSIIIYPLGKFLVNYIGKQGFRDGIQGFLIAIFMSLHSFLVRGKLWQLWDKTR